MAVRSQVESISSAFQPNIPTDVPWQKEQRNGDELEEKAEKGSEKKLAVFLAIGVKLGRGILQDCNRAPRCHLFRP